MEAGWHPGLALATGPRQQFLCNHPHLLPPFFQCTLWGSIQILVSLSSHWWILKTPSLPIGGHVLWRFPVIYTILIHKLIKSASHELEIILLVSALFPKKLNNNSVTEFAQGFIYEIIQFWCAI